MTFKLIRKKYKYVQNYTIFFYCKIFKYTVINSFHKNFIFLFGKLGYVINKYKIYFEKIHCKSSINYHLI